MTDVHDALIAPVAVREFAKAHVLREAVLLPAPNGWVMIFRMGAEERTLRMRDAAEPRYFQTLNAAGRYAQKMGVPRLVIELANWAAPTRPARQRFSSTRRA